MNHTNNDNRSVITVIGAGVMGTSLAIYLAGQAANDNVVRLCGSQWDDSMIEHLSKERHCPRLKVDLPETLELYYHAERKQALAGSHIVIIAVISKGLRETVSQLAKDVGNEVIMASITKGIDSESFQTMAELMEHTLQDCGRGDIPVVKIGGPLRANELAQGYPAEAVFASRSEAAASHVQRCFQSSHFRSEISTDVLGVDLCASMKNVYAIAFGIADGLYPGADNPKAALFGRISVELATIVTAYGGESDTVTGNAGVGDLFVTVQGGRNRTLGLYLGQGDSLQDALNKMQGQTVEGLDAATEGLGVAQQLEKQGSLIIERDLPLLVQLCSVLQGQKSASQAFREYWGGHSQ